MSFVQKTRIVKLLFLLSGMAFLVLITAERPSALLACIGAAALLGVLLFKNGIPWENWKVAWKSIYGALGLGLCVIMGCNFYDRWIDSRGGQLLSAFLHVGVRQLTLAGTVVIVLAAAPVASMGLFFLISTVSADLKEKQRMEGDAGGKIPMKKAFAALMAVYSLGISAILRANFNYIDDMDRVANGYGGWINFSRFLSEALSNFIHMDRYLADISPLPQLIAAFLMAVSGTLLLYIVYDRTSFSAMELVSLIPLGLNPYFLECFSYKYDSPYMALSIFGAILPFLYRKKGRAAYIFASVTGLTIVCTTYQAAVGIYVMIVILLMVRMWCKGETLKKAGMFCLKSMAGFGLGIALFKLILMTPVEASYVTGRLGGDNIKELAMTVYSNLKQYYALIKEDMKPFWLFLIFVIAIGFLWTTARSSERNRVLSFIVTAIGLFLMGILCFGVYPALSKTLFEPRAMYGFGVLITLTGICVAEGRGSLLFRVPLFLLGLAFGVFSFTYGNALYSQKEYTDFRIQMVIEDLNDMELFLEEEPVVVQITGSIGYSPVIRNMPSDGGILYRLVPVTFRGNWWWGQAGFYQYYGLKNVTRDPGINLTTWELPVLEDHMYHTIKGTDHYILVELK